MLSIPLPFIVKPSFTDPILRSFLLSEFSCVEMGRIRAFIHSCSSTTATPFYLSYSILVLVKKTFWRGWGDNYCFLKFHNCGQIRWSSSSLTGLTRPPSLSHCPFFSLCSSHVELCMVLSYIVYFLIFALILLFIRMCY